MMLVGANVTAPQSSSGPPAVAPASETPRGSSPLPEAVGITAMGENRTFGQPYGAPRSRVASTRKSCS